MNERQLAPLASQYLTVRVPPHSRPLGWGKPSGRFRYLERPPEWPFI